MTPPKTNKKSIPDKLAETIEEEMIFGYMDENQDKQYPTLKSSAEWYKVSYDALRQLAKEWDWKQKRKDHKNKVSQKVAAKRKSEEISEAEAEEIIVNDFKFNRTANKLRRAADIEIDKIIEGKIYLYSTKDGNPVFGTPKNAGYLLMNIGRSLESAQKVSKIAAGEPNDISKVEDGTKNEPINEFNRIMDKALNNLNEPVQSDK